MPKKINTNEFIEKSKKRHGDKYDYSLSEYSGSLHKIKITCKKHGEFEQSAGMHILGKGCPTCSKTKKITQIEFLSLAKEIHGNKYDYTLCEYKNAKTKVKIICPKHGIFEQAASSHTGQKTGCPFCSKKHNYSNEEFSKLANLIHNNKFNYDEINYVNNYTKIKISALPHFGTHLH